MDSYENFDLIGDDNLMQDAFKFGDLDADPGCCFSTRDGDWDPFSPSGSGVHTSTTNDASIWSEELLNSIVGAEMVLGSDITNQLDEREAQMGPSEDNSGSLKSVMLIEGDNRCILSKGESQAEIIMCNSENPRVEMAIGGESNAQTHEVEREMGPMEFNPENIGGDMASKEVFVIETSDVEADSGCTLHDPGPLGDSSPETESVVDKIVSSGSMKTSNETEEVEKSIIEEKPTECNSKNVRCQMIIGCSDNTLDERKFHVGPTGLNSVNLGGEMVIEGGRNNELSEGEYYVGRTGKTLKSQIVTKGGRNGQSNERESHAGATVDVSENLLDETLVKGGTDDQSRLVDRQVGPDSPSCENLFGDAEAVTRGDINNKWNEGNCQVGPANELKECIGTSKSSHLIQESAYDVHKVPQGERNTQEEEMTTAVSQSEKCFEQIGPSELYKSVDEKNCTGSRLKFPFKETDGKEERMKSELCGRVLSISPGFSLPETSVVKVDSKCALIDAGPLSSGLPATCLTNDKQVCAPTISNSSLDNNAPLCVATAPVLDSSSIATNEGVHQMESITKIKEAEKITKEEYCSADCGAHTPVELTTGGCSSPIELTEEPSFDAASVEKHDENKEGLNESVLIHSNCKVENSASYKNLKSNLDERTHPAVVEAVPESPAGIGNTEGLHDPSADAMTNGGLQTIQPIQANCSKSDSVKQTTEKNLVTFENSISVREMPSPVTELVCQSDSPSEVIKEITVTETIPGTELHGPRDCMRETMEVLPVIQSVEVKAVDPLDRTIDEEVNVSDVSENSVMNDVTMGDIVRESSPVKLLSEPHGDASSDNCTREIDNDRISLGCMQKKDDEETHDNVVYGIAKMLNAIVKNAGLTLSPVKISSERHADAGTINSTLFQSDAVEQHADDCVLSVNPLMEKITEENSAVNDRTKLELSVTVDDVGPRVSSVKTSFEFNRDISSIDGAPIQLEKKMEDGKFSGNILSEKSTEDNYKNTPTMEDMELSFSPVKITPRSDMDASPIDHVLVTPEDEFKNVKVSDGYLDENRSEGKSSEVSEIKNYTRIEDSVKISSKTNYESTPVDFVPIQSDDVIDDGNGSGDLDVVQLSGLEREYPGAINQRSEATIGSLVEGMRSECESTPVDKQGGVHVGAILTDCAPIQSDIAVSLSEEMETQSKSTSQEMADRVEGMRPECESTPVDKKGEAHVEAILTDCVPIKSDMAISLSHIEVEDLEATNQTDNMVISFGEETEIRRKSTSQEMAELEEGMKRDCESTPVDKQGGAHVGAISTDWALIQSDIAVSPSYIEGEDLEVTNQTDTTVISFGEEMETRNKSTSYEMAELVEGMRPGCESIPVDKQGGALVGAILPDCAAIQSGIAVSLSHIEGEDLEGNNQTDTTVISFGEEMETRSELTSQDMAELAEGMRPDCESTPVDKQGGFHVGAISIDCAPGQSDIAVSLSHIKVEDLEAANQTVTTVVSFGEEMETRSKSTNQEMAELVEGMRPEWESTSVDKQGGAHVGAVSPDCAPIQSDIAVSLSHIEVEDLEGNNQTDTTVISFGEEMETRSELTSQDMAELAQGMRPDCESTPVDKQGGAHVGAVSPDCAPIQSDIAVSLSHIEGEGLEGNNQTDTTVISFGEEMETRCESTSQEMAELAEGMRPECESTPVDKQGGDHVGAILTDCTPIQSEIAVSLSHIEVEDLEAANRSVTTVISFGDEMETQSKSTSQEMSDLVVAENKTAEVVGALLVIAEASSADKLSQNFGDDVSAQQLDDVLQCTLTESKDLKPSLLDFENGEKTCSSSKCSLPEKNVTGVSLGDLSPNVKFDTMKEPQVKFIVPEKLTREDKNSFESPSACASGTVVVEKTEDLKKRSGVSGSNIHSPSTSKAVMSNEALNNTTCAEKNVKLPDLNMPQSATAPSQESMTEAQKMQLRAQIFVYGCLVDGSLPKEENMARSFEESERCIWEPLWHAYSEVLKNRSPLGSGKTPTLSGSRLKKTARRTIQNDTSFNSPYFNWSPAPIFQPFSWHFSPQSRAGQEPLQPTRVRVESEKPSRRRKRSSKDEVCYPGQNYVGRNANLIAAATNNVTPDFNVQTFPVPVSSVPIYATHSTKGKAGLVQAVSSTHGSIVQSRPTSEDLINRSAFLCAALPVFQLQSPSGYYQIAPPAPNCVFVDEASQQAKELSARSSETLHHSPGLQETVTTDKNSSTDPKDEVATAVAAAESVTKAAAAARLASEAARLASEAALQAQLLADEAMSLMDPNPGMEFEMVTPAKVLQSKDKVDGSHAIVSAMREASRRRVKLASAASRRAENVDTILRAAEMAAEAVSQVGQVLMMGDPLPFSIADMVDTIGRDHLRAVQSGEADVSRREKVVDTGLATHDRTMVAQTGEALMRDPVPLSLGQRDLTGPGEDISVEIGGNAIKKGSYVEVTGEKEGLIGVWFGAIVLDFKDGMAHIRHTDLPSCKEEWVPVKMESGAAPMVRLAHSVTALKHDGNRKRRREDESSYSWSIGDHVDAWMRDGWWECIIAKKHDDEAKYTVHLPGKSLVVGEWDLRPSLVWKNGSWVEWVRVKESSEFSKGDSPLKKRQRVCSTPHDVEIVMPRPNPSTSTKIPKPLHQYRRESASSSSETNRKREESVSEPKRTGPRVCFGVPRPNKKTKFLEVTQVSRPRLANNSTLVPNSNGREKWQKPLTKIPEPSKGPDGNLTKVRGKKPMTEPVTRKRVFSSTMLGGQTGTSHRKGVLNVGTGTSNRAGKTIAADVAPTEPRRSCRKVKPTSRLLEGLATDGLMSKIPGVGSIKGSVSLKGSTRQ